MSYCQSPVEMDKATIKCETSPPSSPRSLHLETNFAQFTGSLEDGRGYTQLNTLAPSIPVAEFSLFRVFTLSRKPKKGIKSSIGRLFGKKEKGGRMEPTIGREPLPALTGPLKTKIHHTR